ncbi:MAG: type II toxin-antitoxin system HipA family toxin [Epsilonproteobacteria bacterium]|nr:type II toxin-antitoxin system HipA family toxin [Campylobacterota bacterium]OIO17503.1 MAG: phosphatidylinositol kinase [Helicobacteraceae bacterium CG1_02_36_14]PIP10820.1 MAG: phosphatidylinositol kinase [Sulfurimonas sp. CG23_combo_of_CG06-09_8_20_14_all_36_33]PIS24695.1 MAG: type II toxin-antitoxin system HipA family toxin [Sulfurimonas sp. CG08_land_8_20_14_0_20_36_33]PIU34088.1 MAG: type II toxin-antitoxin system HipA family toxin [Sulfurimonas sp. CG07_land_8_20_14_0_80_36_56]PIV024
MKDNLLIKTNNHLAGKLVFEKSEYIFSYQSQNRDDFISLTMPIREKSYVHTQLHPIFEMHLPEGYLLSIIKKHFAKLVKTDDFGLLNLMAPSINGRVTYESPLQIQQYDLSLENLIHPKSEKLFDELIERFALNSPLSGVQPKVLARVENKATLKLEQYIVKSWGEEYKELAINEYFCMQALKYAKIPTPEFYLSDDDKLFIMKRFDIEDDGKCLGFEDMCVLQARQRDDKYEGSYEQIAKTITTFVSNKNKKTSLINFYKMIILNNILQNGDAHLKNFGLLYDGVENISLAPAYDVISTSLYIKNDVPALHLLGSKKWWDKKFIIRFGMESCSLTKKEANDNYDVCVSALADVKNEITLRLQYEKNEDKASVLEHLLELIKKGEK